MMIPTCKRATSQRSANDFFVSPLIPKFLTEKFSPRTPRVRYLGEMERDDALREARTALCDLLLGRQARHAARIWLDMGLDVERIHAGLPRKFIDAYIDQAAHVEWIAERLERGQILLGGRNNRCGYQPVGEGDDL